MAWSCAGKALGFSFVWSFHCSIDLLFGFLKVFKVWKHFWFIWGWVWIDLGLETSSRLGLGVCCVSTCVEFGFYWLLLKSVLCCLLLATDSSLFWFLSYFQVFPSNPEWKWSLLWLFVLESCNSSWRNWLLPLLCYITSFEVYYILSSCSS